MSRSSRPGLGIPGYAVAAGLLGYGIGVLWSESSAMGVAAALAAAGAVVAVLVAVEVRRSQ